jgi:hypothetical protein
MIKAGNTVTAIHFVRDGILLAYCAGGKEDGSQHVRMLIRKIDYSELIDLL